MKSLEKPQENSKFTTSFLEEMKIVVELSVTDVTQIFYVENADSKTYLS